MKPIFIKISKFWAWVDNLGRVFFGQFIINHFGAESHLSMFKKLKSLYPNIHLGLGFEVAANPGYLAIVNVKILAVFEKFPNQSFVFF